MPTLEATALAAPMPTYARLLRESHALIAQGKGDSSEAEALAERMDQPWYAMTADEQDRMRGLSADLNALLEGGPKRVTMSPEQRAAWESKAQAAVMQLESGAIDAALAFLRQPIPATLPPHFIPVLQARCWVHLGDPETALVFLQEAERASSEVTQAVLNLLIQLRRLDEAMVYAEKILARPEASPVELYLAASALILRTTDLSDPEARPTLGRLVEVLKRAQAGLAGPHADQAEPPGLDAAVAIALGHCHERMGDGAAAVAVYSAALERHQHHADLLVSRGLARVGADDPNALLDFREALRWGARTIWPGYILSRQALLAGAPGEAHRLALEAADAAGPAAVRALIHETIALASLRLGYSPERVLEHFALAVQLDPTNERIRRNEATARSLAEGPAARSRVDWQQLDLGPLGPERIRDLHQQAVSEQQEGLIERRGAFRSENLLLGATNGQRAS